MMCCIWLGNQYIVFLVLLASSIVLLAVDMLNSKIHELVCTDEVDETISIRKWKKKASEQLDKLNSDCNKTAGLEAKLSLAVGARVMLRRNLDTKSGLVNGAMGNVLSIYITTRNCSV